MKINKTALSSIFVFSPPPSLCCLSLIFPRGLCPPGDTVVSALLPRPQINHTFVKGEREGDKAKPLPAADTGLSAWPLARGGFKRVGARGSSHSRSRTTQGHRSKVSPPSPQLSARAAKPGHGRATTFTHLISAPPHKSP